MCIFSLDPLEIVSDHVSPLLVFLSAHLVLLISMLPAQAGDLAEARSVLAASMAVVEKCVRIKIFGMTSARTLNGHAPPLSSQLL